YHGGQGSLRELLDRGKPLFLIFANPNCGPCAALFREVAEWQRIRAELLTIAIISQGNRSEEHTSELQSLTNLVCRLLLEKNNDPGDMIVPGTEKRGRRRPRFRSPSGRRGVLHQEGQSCRRPPLQRRARLPHRSRSLRAALTASTCISPILCTCWRDLPAAFFLLKKSRVFALLCLMSVAPRPPARYCRLLSALRRGHAFFFK